MGAPKVGEGSEYQLVTPMMRLYLPRVEARLRGITTLRALQVGNQSLPRLRSHLLDRIAGVIESRKKCFESFRIIYIGDLGILFTSQSPHRSGKAS